MITTSTTSGPARLTSADLIPDEPLRGSRKRPITDRDDLLQHRVIARKVAELATSTNGKVNIALFGPWGAGKSSFNGLLGEELAAIDPTAHHITFDAWKNAGQGFRTNFLSEVARQIPKADKSVSDQLFQATTRVTFPLADRFSGERRVTKLAIAVTVSLIALFIVAPFLWTIFQNRLDPVDNFMASWLANISGWASIAVGSTLLVVIGTGLVELSKVTVSKSTPSHVTQFSTLFNKLLNADKNCRFVVFIDELDRCGEDDVMLTLEGLRTFLGHERCVFVVAFDRDAVATTVANHMRHNVPTQASSPYYRTSGEYLDKIFQFQVSLPPQPAHTFRRYALSLVRERGGVWEALRNHEEGFLDRVVTVLSPMHLASPRRTKVLLNDFAVNMRVYESLGFDWLDRAGEIAVLTVFQTEFPNLMADIERAPSLMRFLYQDEQPKRTELVAILARYQNPGKQDDTDADGAQLDRIVRDNDQGQIARDMQDDLARYLRRLREMNVAEPKADLILMHSDKALLHFEDPGVYHQVLLAPDMPRTDVIEALASASPDDRALAIDHLLEQAERESAEIALNLRVIASELAADLPEISSKQAQGLRSGISRDLSEYPSRSLEGYARAVARAYTKASGTQVLAAAANHSSDALGAVINRLSDDLTPEDWVGARQTIAAWVLPNANEIPRAAAQVLRRMAEDADYELNPKQINQFASSLSVTEPEPVEPESATSAARKEADEQNTQAIATFEEDRDAVRASTAAIAEVWPQLPTESCIRPSFLKVLRATEGDTSWYLDLHDQLIDQDIEKGSVATANSYLLDAITQLPRQATVRWRNRLSDDSHVDPNQKEAALTAIVRLTTTTSDVRSQINGAGNACRVASLPSAHVSAAPLLAQIASDIELAWEEYSDFRFEYQLQLLRAIDLLEDGDVATTPLRVRLFIEAVASAQAEDASVAQIVASVQSVSPADSAEIARAISQSAPWDEDYPQHPLHVVLAAQEYALSANEHIEHIPAAAISQLTDATAREPIAEQWLMTAPPLSQVETLMGSCTFANSSWQKYGERVNAEQRAATWRKLTQMDAPAGALCALSAAGQGLDIYEEAAASVRDAKTKDARLKAIDRFLALPVSEVAAGITQALVKAVAAEQKRTEVPLGVQLLKAYAPHWSRQIVAGLQPILTAWVEAGEAYVPRKDQRWLAESGLIGCKSSIWGQLFGKRK